MELYLIRHTTPAIEKGICYGQTDIELTATFPEEAARISSKVPLHPDKVYSSPLLRCRKLASKLFPATAIQYLPALMEINCGRWEMCRYDELPQEAVEQWMHDFVNIPMPEGENYLDLYKRVLPVVKPILLSNKQQVLVTHSGVIRCILSYITGTPLQDSFSAFNLPYGCVVRITENAAGSSCSSFNFSLIQ